MGLLYSRQTGSTQLRGAKKGGFVIDRRLQPNISSALTQLKQAHGILRRGFADLIDAVGLIQKRGIYLGSVPGRFVELILM